jgi:uncharacterized protein YndB with AHSA1/START domain
MKVTQELIDGRPALRFERRLPFAVERVWRAISNPNELQCWFVASVAWTPTLGETFEAAGASGEITELDPPRTLEWTWSVERYRFELTPDGDGCVLVFVHVFNPDYGPDFQHAAGWTTYFERLDVHLDGGFLSEQDAHAEFDALLARYRTQFEAA